MRRETGSPKILDSWNGLFQGTVFWRWPKDTWPLGMRMDCLSKLKILRMRKNVIVFHHPRPQRPRILLVSTENHDLWPGPTPEVRNSRTSRYSVHALGQVWQIWLVLVSIYCVYKAIQNRNVVGPGQRSWFQCWPKGSRPLGTRMVFHQFTRNARVRTIEIY